ncbi:MAG: 30S ribosomal protein S13 [Candidatus Margulisbacteria bacterium]|nr:30S ribosomal protein S13 [Candidatus Margulisiibacteriota bacterium]
MVRIVGVDLPNEKHIVIALSYIYGIGPTLAQKILAATNIEPMTRVKNLTDSEVVAIRDVIKEIRVEGDLRKDITLDIKRLSEIGTYRGFRHNRGLPVRGQRTRTNARTRRGKRKTIGMGKRKEEKRED